MKKPKSIAGLIASILFSGVLLITGCSKKDNTLNPMPANPNIFDHDLLVSSANDNGADITGNFTGITFHFEGPYSALSGNANAWNSFLAVSGTWSINTAYDKITFNLPVTIFAQFAYINKQWLITKSNSTTIVLNATNGESDELHFTIK